MIKFKLQNKSYNISSLHIILKDLFIINITSVQYGLLTIWSLIKGCFGNGFWKNNMPWINFDAWKN